MQRGYLSSRDTLLNSLFGEANNDNVGATMVWEWIAWNLDDVSYDFDVSDDGSNGMHAQINYMNSKVALRKSTTHGPQQRPNQLTRRRRVPHMSPNGQSQPEPGYI